MAEGGNRAAKATTMTTMTTIHMSERRPITVVEESWPMIASGTDCSSQYESQAFDGAGIYVRQHADGRTIVSGYAGDWDGGGRPPRRNSYAGFLLAKGDDIVRAIRRVEGILEGTSIAGSYANGAAERCIGNLPSEEIS